MTAAYQVGYHEFLGYRPTALVGHHGVDRAESLLHMRDDPRPDIGIGRVGAEMRVGIRRGGRMSHNRDGGSGSRQGVCDGAEQGRRAGNHEHMAGKRGRCHACPNIGTPNIGTPNIGTPNIGTPNMITECA